VILNLFVIFHVVVSLVGIGSGIWVVCGFLRSRPLPSGSLLFLATTALTSLSGFLLPADHFMPSHAVGLISLVALAVAAAARYAVRLRGGWQKAWVSSVFIALYLNVFVLVVQLFRRVAPLRLLAPTQSEPTFQIVQLGVLATFTTIAVLATVRFRQPAEAR
jgi:hypothetical protein